MNKLSERGKAAAGRANHWVNSSFSDLVGESFSLPGKTKGFQKIEPKKTRKRKVEHSQISSLLNAVVQRDQDEPWVDRYSPHSQDELAIHKKKIEEVENWMKAHFQSLKGGVLLLTGPSGCGKTATVRVLSEELGFQIQEWVNPTNTESFSISSQEEWRTNSMFSSSQQAQFQDFLLRANKYSCLRMRGEEGVTDKKLILVEDMPNQFYRQPSSLHDNLRRFERTSRCPLVFIVSDSLSGDSSSRLLFPKEIQEELNITCISFNPVAPTTMMKVLTRISTLEAAKSCGKTVIPDKKVLEMLCSGSSGDIRSAINSLQFSSLPDSSVEKDLWRIQKDKPLGSKGKAISKTNQRKKKSKKSKNEEEEHAIGGKDASLFLFRALGKILHCKRGDPDDVETDVSTVPVLSSHLSHHHRETLLVNPELVVERSHMSGEFFNLYLHQNYLDFFSEVEDVDRASEYLSDADLFTSNWTHRSIMGDYGSSVATRGLLHSNSQQVSVGFRPLHKPNWLLINKKHRENCLVAQSLFRNFCLSPVSLQTELLPYLAKLTNPMRNQAQITFIQDVGQMPERNFYGRIKLEALTDKEPGQLDTEGEEEEKTVKEVDQGGSEEGLPASQPQPTTSQALLEEEELNIEEYDSD